MTPAILARRRLPDAGERISDYEVVAPIAQGGMAEVLLVRRRGPGGFERRLAMKMMHPHLAGDVAFVHMFLDEARIASCIDHPNVVKVLDVGNHDGLPWLVMEWLDGRALEAVLLRAPPLSMALRAHVLAEVAEGLHAAHEARGPDGAPLGVVHRDVSPQNVHIGFDGVVKVVDFGIAAARGRLTRTDTGQVKGKISYLAPEQILFPSEPIDRRVDVWAFGVMAWETLARRRLFGGQDPGAKMYQIVHAEIPPLAEVAPDAPEALRALVMRCLEREPRARPATMSELATELKSIAAEPHARAAIATYMASAFAEQRDALERQLRERAAAPVERPARQVGNEAPTQPELPAVSVPPPPPKRRRAAALAIAGIVAAVGVGAAVYGSSHRGAAPSAPVSPARPASRIVATTPPPPRVEATPVAEVPPRAPAVPARVIELAVGRGVASVRANGELRDERPLRLELAEGESVELELRGRDGRRVVRSVGVADDGRTLELPRRRRGSLWESPY